MRTLDEIFAEVKERGWKVSNLFELETGMWQCNVRRSNDLHNGSFSQSHEFCTGANANEAAEGVLRDMAQPRNNVKRPPAGAPLEYVQSGGRSPRSRALDLDKLIEDSGL